jgi:hypothetical protein
MFGSNNHTGQPGTAVAAGISSYSSERLTDRAAVKASPDDDAPPVLVVLVNQRLLRSKG